MNISIACKNNTQIRRIRSRIMDELRLLNLPHINILKVDIIFSLKPDNADNNPVICNLKVRLSETDEISISSEAHSELSAYLNAYQLVSEKLQSKSQHLEKDCGA